MIVEEQALKPDRLTRNQRKRFKHGPFELVAVYDTRYAADIRFNLDPVDVDRFKASVLIEPDEEYVILPEKTWALGRFGLWAEPLPGEDWRCVLWRTPFDSDGKRLILALPHWGKESISRGSIVLTDSGEVLRG